MNNLVSTFSGVTMSSREISELTLKLHKNVMADCRAMFEALGIQSADFSADYKDDKGRTYQEFLLDQDLTMTLVMGYSIELRHRVAKRWRELESASAPLIPQTFADALRLAADQAEKLALAAPKVEFVDKFVDRSTLMTATQIGQHIGMSAIILNRHLDNLNVYSSNVKRAKVFRQWFIDKGYGTMKQTDTGYSQPLFTTSGQYWISSQIL